jgi:hypothetical protein
LADTIASSSDDLFHDHSPEPRYATWGCVCTINWLLTYALKAWINGLAAGGPRITSDNINHDGAVSPHRFAAQSFSGNVACNFLTIIERRPSGS